MSAPHSSFAPGWTVERLDRHAKPAVIEALLCMTSRGFGTRACNEMGDRVNPAGVLVNGRYGPEPPGALISGADWIPRTVDGRNGRWRLDLSCGLVEHVMQADRTVRSTRFASAARPGVAAYSTDVPEHALQVRDEPIVVQGVDAVSAVWLEHQRSGESQSIIAAVATAASVRAAIDGARTAAHSAARTGFQALLCESRNRWAELWRWSDMAIDGPLVDQIAARFALYHLLSLTGSEPELALGARGFTGTAYAGHVFWDSDMFVLPAMAAIDPPTALSMLRYRARRLDAARNRAAAEARPGARYPWESAVSGGEVSPTSAVGIDGQTVAIRTGELEIHISADIAWSVLHHATWTGSDVFLDESGRDIVLDTARYFASRIDVDEDGCGHIRGVIGPDEYHEAVDDNAYTNNLVRWHLRRAAGLTPDREEAQRFHDLALRLWTGYDSTVQRHEQFAGFLALDPVLIEAVATPPIAADLLLGHETIARLQVVKQADVIMMHHVLGDQLPAGSLERDLAFYGPRTAHGSSLSPAIHASALARAGRADDALRWLRIALRLDLDDLTGTTAGGVHFGTLGGVWQALAFGFLGLRVEAGLLRINPILPSEWSALTLHCHVLGRRIAVSAAHDECTIDIDGAALPIAWGVARSPMSRTWQADHLRLVGGHDSWRLS